MKKHKLLMDISFGHRKNGFSGIPQDTRLLFNGFLKSQTIDASGLIYGNETDVFNLKTDNNLEETAVFLGIYLESCPIYSDSNLVVQILRKLLPRITGFVSQYQADRVSRFDLRSIAPEFLGIIWRNIFSQTLEAHEEPNILKNKYYWTRMSLGRICNSFKKTFPDCYLDTHGFDFVIFQDTKYVKLSPKTKRIIRYHDAIPIFASDTCCNQTHTQAHLKSIQACAKDSIYVCNSPSSLDDLATIAPIAAENARVIPYFVPKMQKQEVTYNIFRDICALRRSESTLPLNKEIAVELWFKDKKEIPKFVMSLATIEPRKNFIGLINAWSNLRYKMGEDIKLLIVGQPGWLFETTLRAMRPFVESGNLMHLEVVAQHELPYLYSAAGCFVFPSFTEGFGLPPIEAMQCDCPVALSNIPAHRYSAGDAALYFNPYDIDEMTHKIKSLLDVDNNRNMINDLIKKGRMNIERYSYATVLPQWERMFDELKRK